MGEIKIKGPVVPIKSDKNSETSKANKINEENDLTKLPFTTNIKGPTPVDPIGVEKNS